MEHRIFELTWSNYTHYCLKLQMPDSGWDEYRPKIVIGFYRLFFVLRLWKTKANEEFGRDAPSYGISFHNNYFWIHHGYETLTIRMPWDHQIVRWDLLYASGSTLHRNPVTGFRLGDKKRDINWHDVLSDRKNPYYNTPRELLIRHVVLEHKTKDGEVQKANIRLAGEVREWRPLATKRFPIFRNIRTTVDCESDIELGERAGSWKGGMIGWGVPWDPNTQTMEEAFWQWYKDWDGR